MRIVTMLFTAILMLGCATAYAEITLTLGNAVVPDHPRAKACKRFADTVERTSNGRIVVEIAGDTTFGNDTSMVNALLNGTLDMTANSQGAVSEFVPEYSAFGMPFLFSKPAEAWRLLDGEPGKALARKSAEKGLVVLGFWDNGIRHISNNVRRILVPRDVKGLKIRTPPDPVTEDIIEALGGQVHKIKMSELYNALQRKVVDGEENPLFNIYGRKLYEVQRYISLTGHKYEMTPFLMARSSWDRLSDQDRKIILSAADDSTRYQRELSQQANDKAYNDLIAKGVRIDRIDTKPFKAATRKVYNEWYASPIGDYVRSVVNAARRQRQ